MSQALTIDRSRVASARIADRLMLPVLWILFGMALALASWNHTWNLAVWVGLPLALVPTAMIFLMPGQRATRLAVAVAFMLFCGLHIHQAMGTTELHFGIFVLLAVLLCYRDWLVILVAALVAAVHHLSFNYLQELGYPAYCFASASYARVFAHAGYVVFEATVLCYIAHWMQRDASQAAELTHIVDHVSQEGRINLSAVEMAPDSPVALRLHQVLQAVSHAVSNVRENVLSTGRTLERMAVGNEALGTGASRQASAIEQAVSSISALSDSLAQDLQRAKGAQQEAARTAGLALEGSQSMGQSVDHMQEMQVLSRQIGEITALIDGIAFQTNILALNASVEAARAGAQGQGFAVVANEVRTLAQRSADASHQIRERIETSVKQVADGTTLIEHNRQVMEQLSQGVQNLASTLQQLLQANQDQSDRIQSLQQAISQIQSIGQDNLHQAQETNDLMQELGGGAKRLTVAVRKLAV